MNEQQPYEKHLAEKLRHLPPPGDKDNTWEEMKILLDKEMPRGGGMNLYRRWWIFGAVVGALFLGTWLTGKLTSETRTPETTAASSPKQTTAEETVSAGKPAVSAGDRSATQDIASSPSNAANKAVETDAVTSGPAAGNAHPATVNGNTPLTGKEAHENDAGSMASTRRTENKSSNNNHIKDADEAIITRNNTTLAGKNKGTKEGNSLAKEEKINNRSGQASRGRNGHTKAADLAGNKEKKGKQTRDSEQPDKDIVQLNDNVQSDDITQPRNSIQGNNTAFINNSKPSKPEENLRATKVRAPLRYIDALPRPELIPGPQLQKDYALAGGWLPHAALQSTAAAKKKLQKHREQGVLAAGFSLPLAFPLGDQRAMGYNFKGGHNTVSDYIPSPHLQYHFNSSTYVQTEVQFMAPQFIRSTLLYNHVSTWGPNMYSTQSIYAKKLYYLNIPVTVHYSPFPRFYLGTGLQFSSLVSGIALTEEKKWNGGPGGTSIMVKERYTRFRNDSLSRKINGNEFRLLIDINYYWNRFNVGLRYNQAFSNYISFRLSPAMPYSFDKNRALQFYLRYNIWEDRKRNKPATNLLTFK